MLAKRRLYLTADKSQLVAEGDPRAAFLYAAAGDEIPDSAAQLYRLVNGDLPPNESETESDEMRDDQPPQEPGAEKQKPAPKTKERQAPETKGA